MRYQIRNVPKNRKGPVPRRTPWLSMPAPDWSIGDARARVQLFHTESAARVLESDSVGSRGFKASFDFLGELRRTELRPKTTRKMYVFLSLNLYSRGAEAAYPTVVPQQPPFPTDCIAAWGATEAVARPTVRDHHRHATTTTTTTTTTTSTTKAPMSAVPARGPRCQRSVPHEAVHDLSRGRALPLPMRHRKPTERAGGGSGWEYCSPGRAK